MASEEVRRKMSVAQRKRYEDPGVRKKESARKLAREIKGKNILKKPAGK